MMKSIKTLSLILVASTLMPASVHAWSWSDVVKPLIGSSGMILGSLVAYRNGMRAYDIQQIKKDALRELNRPLKMNERDQNLYLYGDQPGFKPLSEYQESIIPQSYKKYMALSAVGALTAAASTWYLVNYFSKQ